MFLKRSCQLHDSFNASLGYITCLKKKKSRLIEKFGFGFNFSPRSEMCDPVNGGRGCSVKGTRERSQQTPGLSAALAPMQT